MINPDTMTEMEVAELTADLLTEAFDDSLVIAHFVHPEDMDVIILGLMSTMSLGEGEDQRSFDELSVGFTTAEAAPRGFITSLVCDLTTLEFALHFAPASSPVISPFAGFQEPGEA